MLRAFSHSHLSRKVFLRSLIAFNKKIREERYYGRIEVDCKKNVPVNIYLLAYCFTIYDRVIKYCNQIL